MCLLSVRKLAQLLNSSVARLREIADEIDRDVNSHYRFHSEKKPGSAIARGRIAYVRTCNPGPAGKLMALLEQRCAVGVYGSRS